MRSGMDKHEDSTQEIEDYIRRVQSEEKTRSRKKFILIGILSICTLSAGAFGVFKLAAPPPEFVEYNQKTLSVTDVESHLGKGVKGIIIADTSLGLVDTVYSLEEYLDYVRIYQNSPQELIPEESGSGFDDEFYEPEQDDSDQIFPEEKSTPATETPKKLKPKGEKILVDLKIEGTKEVGNTLIFKIPDYNPSYAYYINLGNGEKRKVNGELRYKYPEAGTFNITMVALGTNSRRGEINQRISISRRTITEDKNYEAIVEKPALDKPVSPIAQASDGNLVLDQAQDRINQPQIIDNQSGKKSAKSSTPTRQTNRSESRPSVQPLDFAAKMPVFPAGEVELLRFFKDRIKYPTIARENGIEGTVYIQFVVHTNGALSDFKVLRGLGYGCDEEALRIAKGMPDWLPGENNGEKVPVKRTVGVRFNID